MVNEIAKITTEPGKGVGFQIPLTSAEFGEFLASLLKSPRRIQFYIPAQIFVTREKIRNLHFLLTQRLNEQHVTQLTGFELSIHYDDGRSVTLTSFDELETYSEITDAIAIQIEVEWIFLIDLPNLESPQKQTIRVIQAVERKKVSALTPMDIVYSFSNVYQHSRSYKTFVVEHTHVTLGNDVANILITELKKDQAETKAQRVLQTPAASALVTIALFTLSFVIIVSPILTAWKSAYFDGNSSDVIISSGKLTASVMIGIFYTVGSILASGALSSWIFARSGIIGPSFIVFSEHSEQKALKKLEAHRRRLIVKAVLGVGSVISAVASGLLISKISDLL